MKKLILVTALTVLGAATVFAKTTGRFSDESNARLIENMKTRTCDQILTVLLDNHAEANRLSNAAIVRLQLDENDKHGLALADLADGAYKGTDLLTALLKEKCFKQQFGK